MNTAVKTILQALGLVIVGGAVGLAANGLRENGLSVTRDYYPVRQVEPRTATIVTIETAAAPSPVKDGKSAGLPAHIFQVVTLEEAFAAFNSPDHKPGQSDSRVFFIDARGDADFNDGHIPGALQVDHYRVEKYMPDVRPMLDEAEKIIVYCNGGTCEDSILVSHDLKDAKVSFEKIYLFEGGMKAWKEAKHPVE